MRTAIEQFREDRITIIFEDEEIDVDAGFPPNGYKARLTRLQVRLTPRGELLSVVPTGKKIKRDGTKSQVNAYFSYTADFTELALQLLAEAGYHAWRP